MNNYEVIISVVTN